MSTFGLKIDVADKSSEKSLLLQMGEVGLKGFFQKDYIDYYDVFLNVIKYFAVEYLWCLNLTRPRKKKKKRN